MNRSEVLTLTDCAWTQLSRKRGWKIDRDAPVCIQVCEILQPTIPGSRLIKVPVPECDDFQAVLATRVDGTPSIVDPVHLTWRKRKPMQAPSLEEATLIVPIMRGWSADRYIPNAHELEKPYIRALSRLIAQLAGEGRT